MGCSTTVVKYLVFFFNLIFAIAGAAVLGVGVLIKLKNDDIQNFIPDKYHLNLPPILLIIIGSIIFATAFFGCCGAIKRKHLPPHNVAIGAYAFLQVGDTQDLRASVQQAINKTFNDYNLTETSREEFNFLQTYLKCCGVEGPKDWKWGGKVPDSCCSTEKNCTKDSVDCYQRGCTDVAYKWFKNGLDLLGILAIAIASIEIIGAIFALCLSSSIKNQIRREAYA
ncbi:hypothetical protein NQ317_005176 [Molorchus minor]|uniref:Tetraspanin n=1 Tax=Molorchus minor TaxID=1323400 RepID=A0ABQ9JD17_9CUCU|nr:hypothetical protein NQ317_005176 [Molorchus minor]